MLCRWENRPREKQLDEVIQWVSGKPQARLHNGMRIRRESNYKNEIPHLLSTTFHNQSRGWASISLHQGIPQELEVERQACWIHLMWQLGSSPAFSVSTFLYEPLPYSPIDVSALSAKCFLRTEPFCIRSVKMEPSSINSHEIIFHFMSTENHPFPATSDSTGKHLESLWAIVAWAACLCVIRSCI